ncbi:MAG: GNAT family N-acetyltransferase [Actinomycetota bacterium]
MRAATVADCSTVQRIVDSHQLTLDPDEKRFGEAEALQVINGFIEPAMTRLIRNDAAHDWESFLSINPDNSRLRAYLDIYVVPGSELLPVTFETALRLACEEFPSYRLWLGVHAKDVEYQRLLARRGFSLLRKYWAMEVALREVTQNNLPRGAKIREIDLRNDDDVLAYWRVHQDSFSRHFGFAPRKLKAWTEMVRRDQAEVNMRVWMLNVDGHDAGFVDCDDSMIHEGCGFVSGLGVRHAFQGRGYGEALLRFAMNQNQELGREKVVLSVDTGNESGALRLYEKVGMKPISEWHQYENMDWTGEARRR